MLDLAVKSRTGRVQFYTIPKGRLAPYVGRLLPKEIQLGVDVRVREDVEKSGLVRAASESQAFLVGGGIDVSKPLPANDKLVGK